MSVHKQVDTKTVEFLRHLGFTTDEINIYLQLLSRGPLTVLAISRGLKTGRTKLYPQLQEMCAKKLVIEHEKHYGTNYEAAGLQTLEFKVHEAEAHAASLRSRLPFVLNELGALSTHSPATTQISESSGSDALKQALWNLTQHNEPVCIFLQPLTVKLLGNAFLNKILPALPSGSKYASSSALNKLPVNLQTKSIPKSNLKHSILIQKNVFTTVSINKQTISVITTKSPDIAAVQRQLFEYMWASTS